MIKLLDALTLLLLVITWGVAGFALVQSDGVCPGECEGCVYAGWCPQERRDR